MTFKHESIRIDSPFVTKVLLGILPKHKGATVFETSQRLPWLNDVGLLSARICKVGSSTESIWTQDFYCIISLYVHTSNI